jgi:uncharacterized protein YggE
MKRTFLVLLLLSMLICSCSKKERTINVSGTGTVTFVPDIIQMSITVKNVNPRLNDSLLKTKDTITKALAVCKNYKIDDIDIKSSYINSGKEYHWDSRTSTNKFDGYYAAQTTQITYRDLSKLEELSSELLKLNITSIDKIVFDHSSKEKYESEANLLALDNAKLSAQKIAERMGVKLKEIVYISDINGESGYRDGYEVRAFSKSLNTGIVASPGILSVSKNVHVVYRIK